MSNKVRLVEVGPRDGLQNEAGFIDAATKIRLIERLAAAGLKTIEAGAFVSPKWVPQMADTADVLAGLAHSRAVAGVQLPVLVPNMQGYDLAAAAGVNEISVFTAASEAFTQRNINATIEESFARFEPVVKAALAAGIRVRGYVSTVIACPYAGPVAPHAVADVTARLLELGCYEVSLGDTIGVGRPREIKTMLEAVLKVAPAAQLALHCHDTYGQAVANIRAGLDKGIRVFDVSVGGLGGCPYAPGAGGNVATEDVLYLLAGEGLQTGVDLAQVVETAWYISGKLGSGKLGNGKLGRKPTSKVALALGQTPVCTPYSA